MKHEQLENTVVIDRINHYISLIDRLITVQLNEILHHSQFQALEASWRGLEYLTETVSKSSLIFIKIISIPWPELARDFARCSDIEDSFLFKKIYNEEFGMPGGVPYGIMLCDYQIHHRAYQDHKIDDIAVLTALSSVGAAAFVPMILNASPRIFGLDFFSGARESKKLKPVISKFRIFALSAIKKKRKLAFSGVSFTADIDAPALWSRKPS